MRNFFRISISFILDMFFLSHTSPNFYFILKINLFIASKYQGSFILHYSSFSYLITFPCFVDALRRYND